MVSTTLDLAADNPVSLDQIICVRDWVGLKDIEMLVGAEKFNIPVGIPIREVC